LAIFQSNFTTIKYLYYFNFIVSCIYLVTFGFSIQSFIIVAAVFFMMNPLGIAVSYHRYWSHKSFEWKNGFYKYLCTVPALISGVGSILGWVGLHRRHHKFSDVDGDPHLAAKGFWNMLFMTSYDYQPQPKEVIDLMRDPFIVKTHQYYFLFPVVYGAVLFAVLGIHGLVLGYCMPAAVSLVTQNTTNYVNHWDSSKFSPNNVGWINFFNFGDGWHENHHKDPSCYTTQREWWQIDPAGWAIKYIFSSSVNDVKQT